MSYPLSLIVNFVAVLILVRFTPGLVTDYGVTSPFGSDLLFSAVTAFFNASVFFCLILMEIFPTKLKLAVLNGIISFAAFTLVAIIPYGFQPNAAEVAIGGILTWLVSFLVSYFALRRWIQTHHQG